MTPKLPKHSIPDHVRIGLECGSMLDAEQLTWVSALARLAPGGPACELGVYTGGSFICWASQRYIAGRLYAVDPFGPAKKWARAEAVFRQHCAEHLSPLTSYEVVKATTTKAAARVPDDLAFLFIDAAHDAGGIDLDIKIWPNKIRPGGIIVFHDYISSSPTAIVGETVDTWQAAAQWHDLGMVGSARAFERPVF